MPGAFLSPLQGAFGGPGGREAYRAAPREGGFGRGADKVSNKCMSRIYVRTC
jgi:hypothetical protein